MNTIQEEVLALFREEILGYINRYWKETPLEFDSDLFEVPGDDLRFPEMICTKLWRNLKKDLMYIYRKRPIRDVWLFLSNL